MHALLGCLVAFALAQPSGDPRTIDPAANRPEIVAPGGAPTKVEPKVVVAPNSEVDEIPTGRCFPARGRCWRLNVVGIIGASVGVGMLGTGIGFTKAPNFPAATDPNEPIFDRSLRPPGVILAALGGVVAVTGAIMIIAGHASHKKPPRENDTARVELFLGGIRW